MRQPRKWVRYIRNAMPVGVVFVAACVVSPPGSGLGTKSTAPAKPAAVTKSAAPAKPAAAKPAAVAAAPRPAVTSTPKPRAGAVTIAAANPNAFNRLMRRHVKRHLPPWKDGNHNPNDPDVRLLQAPLVAFADLPKTRSGDGNGVAWVKALDEGKIHPRWKLNNPKAKPVVMNLNIVFDVKGSMPDVVYPHKAHTQWLDCSNCHPAIFIPRKGADQISMASIMMGKKCGVCHGRVAFPISDCMRCHSKGKSSLAKAKP